MQDKFAACVQEWSGALPIGTLLDAAESADYEKNCQGVARHIIAVLKPQSEAEVVTIVRIANANATALYTVSTGHNWGYGSSVPVVDSCAILDLSRMNTILDFDPELGLVSVEPGVTQQQLYDYLNDNHYDYYAPTTGAGPTTSIVGNALEHGFGMTPMEDHFNAVSSVRAVLADGRIYASSFAELGAAQAGVWKWGIGPYIDGLFAQANMGIVTALQITLVKRTQHTEAYVFTLKEEVGLERLLDACKHLLEDMHGTIGNIKLVNRTAQGMIEGAPVTLTEKNSTDWIGVGVFRCRKAMTKAIRKEVQRSLKPYASNIVFLNKQRVDLLLRAAKLIPRKTNILLHHKIARAQYLIEAMDGVPRSDALKLAYQHVAFPKNVADPARDGVGVIWYAPVLPLKNKQILQMIVMMRSVLAKYNFPDAISFTTTAHNCAIGVIPIIYKLPEEAEKAQACFRELWEQGNALGCPPYRVPVTAMETLTDPTHSVYWQTVAQIKAVLDTNRIFSPGRYAPLR